MQQMLHWNKLRIASLNYSIVLSNLFVIQICSFGFYFFYGSQSLMHFHLYSLIKHSLVIIYWILLQVASDSVGNKHLRPKFPPLRNHYASGLTRSAFSNSGYLHSVYNFTSRLFCSQLPVMFINECTVIGREVHNLSHLQFIQH